MRTDRSDGTNRHFHHTESSAGTPAAVWALWTDVASWHCWDQGLKRASIDGPVEVGAQGALVPNRGPKTTFEITDLRPCRGYTFATRLPGARLHVRRELLDGPVTTFSHTVWFDGPLAGLWARLSGPGFRRQLPPTMRRLAELAADPTA